MKKEIFAPADRIYKANDPKSYQDRCKSGGNVNTESHVWISPFEGSDYYECAGHGCNCKLAKR